VSGECVLLVQAFLDSKPCIKGRILANGSYFKEPNDALANQLLGEQLEDGGWTLICRLV
jgi:squalene cyclase